MRIEKLRATTNEWRSTYPWHFGGSIPPNNGPVIGVDRLSGNAPFGLDPFEWVRTGIVQNPNAVIAGAPANGKSALTKMLIWWLTGCLGYRFAAVDVKGEYLPLAKALEVPVLDLHPDGIAKVNPLEKEDGRLEFVNALAALCVDRVLTPVEAAALAAAVRALPPHPIVADLVQILREMPKIVLNELVMDEKTALHETNALRFGLQALMSGVHAGMFDSETNVDLADSPRGFVVDVSGCGSDDQALRFALLVGMRAVDQLVASAPGQTLVVNDEAWRLAGNLNTVRWMQHSFKLGRNVGKGNVLVLHRFSELGHQADGAVGEIASRLVSDADIHIVFRQGDLNDARDTVQRLNLPASTQQLLMKLPPHRCLINASGKLALVDIKLSPGMRVLAETNGAMEAVA
jgi:type IV secretory pathway VirB4 component